MASVSKNTAVTVGIPLPPKKVTVTNSTSTVVVTPNDDRVAIILQSLAEGDKKIFLSFTEDPADENEGIKLDPGETFQLMGNFMPETIQASLFGPGGAILHVQEFVLAPSGA